MPPHRGSITERDPPQHRPLPEHGSLITDPGFAGVMLTAQRGFADCIGPGAGPLTARRPLEPRNPSMPPSARDFCSRSLRDPCEAAVQQQLQGKAWSHRVSVLADNGRLPLSLLSKVRVITGISPLAIPSRRVLSDDKPLRTLHERRKSVDLQIVRHRTERKLARVFGMYCLGTYAKCAGAFEELAPSTRRGSLRAKAHTMDRLCLAKAADALTLDKFSRADVRKVTHSLI